MRNYDLEFLRDTFKLARESRSHGNHPFSAILVDGEGNFLMQAENSVVTTGECIDHAETNLIRMASAKFDRSFLENCTLYASTEPCPMCAGAIFWSNVRRVVFGLSEEGLYSMVDPDSEDILIIHCSEILSRGKKDIEVIGPLLEDEALDAHRDFWK